MMNILVEANRLVNGDRGDQYGHPSTDFGCTAAMWRAFVKRRYDFDVQFSPEDVGLMMVCVKLSREAGKHGNDNLVDGAGYLQTVAMCIDKRRADELLTTAG